MTCIATAPVSRRGNTLVARRSYQCDTLGRPTSRTLARQGATRNDVFTYNDRSELISDVVDGTGLNGWDYDNIGNRLVQQQGSACDTYTSNQLNQYTAIEDEAHDVFTPTYDDDGNQTRIKTSTGIWNVTYNAKNRPVLFSKEGENLTVACTYDYMGRRATKVVTENGVVTTSHRFLYRGYLQIACCDRKRATHPCLWLITWDPTQPIATRPLAIQKDSTWYTYGWDLTKNIWEAYTTTGYIGTAYTYTAYGQVTASGTVEQPIQWSSEYNDTETSMIYYNFRFYSSANGKWILRDPIPIKTKNTLYEYSNNSPVMQFDMRGLLSPSCSSSIESSQLVHIEKCPEGAKLKPAQDLKDNVSGCHCNKQLYKYRTDTPKKGYSPSANGCGGEGGEKVPEDFWLFNIKEACNNHDRCYGTCGKNKKKCDAQLFSDIYNICMNEGGWLLHPICLDIGYIYAGFVLALGGKYYDQAQDEGCEWQLCVKE